MLVCEDLSLPQQVVQAVHAAHEAGRLLTDKGGLSVAVCSVPNERKLHLAHARIEDSGIRAVLFREPDLGGRATAIATEPVNHETFRNTFRKYRLWGGRLR